MKAEKRFKAGGALLARGTEGEAVADTRRQVQIDWLHDGICETRVAAERSSASLASSRAGSPPRTTKFHDTPEFRALFAAPPEPH